MHRMMTGWLFALAAVAVGMAWPVGAAAQEGAG